MVWERRGQVRVHHHHRHDSALAYRGVFAVQEVAHGGKGPLGDEVADLQDNKWEQRQ